MNFSTLWQHLSDPEYIHVLINPLPVYGLSMGVLGLALALILRTPKVTVAALVLVFIGGISAWPTYHYGEAGYDRVKALSDDAGGKWLDEHMARAEKLIWMFYVLAGVSAISVVAVVKRPQSSFAVSVVTLVLGTATLGAGGYIAYAGGHVRHREFRFEPPPEGRMEVHHHGDEGAAHEEHAESQSPTPMDHGSMPGMESTKSPVPPQGSPTQEQLDASRMQLDASRLQLEASRKQLEATDATKPGASSSPSATQSPHDGAHDHEHKP